ncbi:uro-adherence factor A isoform X10 [Drosophila kikkawai]|uniref:Uro-adherence factor A isoform X10 n=1 Tax=Drosophila kikkawai TaxID=30033 RepID=A0ABM4GCW3_DROKI
MEPAATEGGISQAAVDAVDSVPPVEQIPETQTVKPAAPLEIASDVEPPAPVEIIPESQSTVMEPAATEGGISQAAVDAVDSVPPVEEIPETQTVEPAAPQEIASDVEPPAPVEIIPESQSTVMEPAATEGSISQSELEAVDSVSPVEVIPETQTVEPAALFKVLPDVELIAAPETTICQNVLTAVDPVSPVEVISETQSVDPSAILTVSSEVDPPAPVDIILESQSTDVELAATEKAISEAKLIAVASVELASETHSVDIFTAVLPEKLRQTEVVAREPSTSKEILPKTESVDLEPSEPGEVDKEAQLGNVVPEAQSIVARLEDVLPVKSASEEAPHTIQELISETLSLQEEESVAEKTDPEGQTIAVLSKLSPSEVPTNDQQIINTGDQLSEKCITEPAKPVVDPHFERNSSIDSLKSDCSALGSIAEREVKKWYNAVEMPNNPYAPEALKQRISGTQERYMDVPNISPSAEQKALASALTENTDPPSPQTDYKRYSRDYYINNAPKDSTGVVRATAASSFVDQRRSAGEDVEDIVINEAQKASQAATEQDQPLESVYKALPVQVLDESLDSQSNPSLHSLQTTTTTTSDESDTVRIYDFNKQETTVIRAAPASEQPQHPNSSTSSSMESAQSASPSVSSIDSSVSKKRERPVVLQFGPGDSAPTIGSPASTPTRGSTPPAFRFLQPKRRLIDPSQVLSVDEDDVPEPPTPAAERPVIEVELGHAMPSVKALAQAFLLTSKHTQPQRRWRQVRLAAPPDAPNKPGTSLPKRHRLEHAVSMAEVADESTIASDLSSLETDPSLHSEGNPPIASPASPVPVRHGFLRSNIAFFENLKFK